MLVLTLKKGAKVAVGSSLFEVITLYKENAYIKYKGQTVQVTKQTSPVGEDLEVIYKGLQSRTSARFGFNSPKEIWMLQDRTKPL